MSVIKQNWQSYSKLKHNLGKDFSSLTESHATEMSNLKATLAQGGLTTDDPTYSLRVNKLLADQMDAQESITAARDELKTGAINEVLTNPYYDESYGTYVTGLAASSAKAEHLKTLEEKRQADFTSGAGGSFSGKPLPLGDEQYKTFYYDNAEEATSKLDELGTEYQGMEEFYGAKYGEYTAPIEEVRAEKSAASMAQVRGVSGGQMSKTKRRKPSGASAVGGNKFLGATSSLGAGSSGWWS